MTHSHADIRKGLWLGLLGIVIFSATLPMTRLAVGTPGTMRLLVTLRGYNLGDERYAEIGGYAMPGRSFALELSTR